MSWILFAVIATLAALVAAYCAHPLMKGSTTDKRLGWLMIGGIGISALTFYLLLGSPGIPAYPALFDKTGPRAEMRALTGEELAYMQALADEPENKDIMLQLANVRIRAGRPEDALTILKRAITLFPHDKDVRQELGAAHYAAALTLLTAEPPDKDDAQYHITKGLEAAPADAPYRQELSQLQTALSGSSTASE